MEETNNLESYQNHVVDTSSDVDEDVNVGHDESALLIGYGSVDRCVRDAPHLAFDPTTDFPLDDVDESPATAGGREKSFRHWRPFCLAAVFYLSFVGAVVWRRNKESSLWSPLSSEAVVKKVELLGRKSKTKKSVKKAKKEKKKESAKKKKGEKKKESAKRKKDENKKEHHKKKENKKKKEVAAKAAAGETKKDAPATFEAAPYPGCLTVEVKYVKTPLPFADHELAAKAAGCHLASIHSLVENTKLSAGGLFAMSLGPEIGMSFASGKVLSKEFWLGAYNLDGSGSDPWTWTDDSPWDFGPVGWDNATKGCLASSINFTETHLPSIPAEDHFIAEECLMPLPAVYKCCTTYMPPSSSPSEFPSFSPSEEPSATPSETPTDVPTDHPSEYPTDSPTETPTGVPTDYPSEDPTATPSESPSSEPTETPSEPPTHAPSNYPTESPTELPTDWPTDYPTEYPSIDPTEQPTGIPTLLPTPGPTKARKTHRPIELVTPSPSMPLETENPTLLLTPPPKKAPKKKLPAASPTIAT